MEYLSRLLAQKIGKNINADEEKISVMAYGLAAFFQMIIILALISVVSLVGGFWFECAVAFFSVGFLRRSVGGAHSSSYIGCVVVSTVTIIIFGAVSHFCFSSEMWYIVILIEFFCAGVAFLSINKFAPVDSPNKPILRPEKIKRLRKNAFITIAIYTVVAVVVALLSPLNVFSKMNFIGMAVSLTLSTLWQTFVITPFGAKFVSLIDVGRYLHSGEHR